MADARSTEIEILEGGPTKCVDASPELVVVTFVSGAVSSDTVKDVPLLFPVDVGAAAAFEVI